MDIFEKNKIKIDIISDIISRNNQKNSLEELLVARDLKKIIIYGYDVLGATIFRELKDSKKVDVVAIIANDPVEIKKIPKDLLIINITENIPSYDALVVSSIDEDDFIKNNLLNAGYKNVISINNLLYSYYQKSEGVGIGIYVNGTLGDLIVRKSVIMAIKEKGLLGENGFIELYVFEQCTDFAKTLFSDCEYVKKIYNSKIYRKRCYSYDLAITLGVFVNVDNYNYNSLYKKNRDIAKKIENIVSIIKNMNLNINKSTDQRLFYDRCRFNGLDQYTGHNYGNELCVTNNKVPIPLLESAGKEFSDLKMNYKYITINYGWAEAHKRHKHCKIWQFDNYDVLIRKIKSKYGSIKVVQLGIPISPIMVEADIVIRNKNIEVVKYILKHSILHVDCEGGLVHLASQLGTKCAVLFGSTPVYYYGYANNINILAGDCHDCYKLLGDYTKCARELEKPECMDAITPKYVMECISKYLDVALGV